MERALIVIILISGSLAAFAQKPDTVALGAVNSITATAKVADTAPDALAKAALAAHGGDKLRQLKALVIKGSVDVNVSNQIMAGGFSSAVSGSKYYLEISTPMQSFKQVSDGEQTYSSLNGILLPPLNSVGFTVLGHVGEAGYTVAGYGDGKKKVNGFRVTTPDGFYTDFTVDEKTSQIKGFESAFELANGRLITTSVAIDEMQTADGIVLPKKFSQRFDLGGFTAYANFKAKDVLVNPQMADSAFAIPK